MKSLIVSVFLIITSNTAFADQTNLSDLIWSGKNSGVISVLKQHPELVNQSRDGFTPLHLASMVDNLEIVQFLIDSGADVNALDMDGFSALVRANANGHERISKLLSAHGGKEIRLNN